MPEPDIHQRIGEEVARRLSGHVNPGCLTCQRHVSLIATVSREMWEKENAVNDALTKAYAAESYGGTSDNE